MTEQRSPYRTSDEQHSATVQTAANDVEIRREHANGLWADVCQTCGIAVWDVPKHLRWHGHGASS